MAFLNSDELLKRDELGNEFYYGTVVDNNDPLLLFRVKVRINALYGTKIADEDLPWCSPARSSALGADGASGWYAVPRVDSKLLIMFDRSIYSPRYVASPLSKLDPYPDMDVNYPDRYGFTDPVGNKLIIDLSDNSFEYISASGTKLLINSDGDLMHDVVGDLDWDVDGEINMRCVGAMNLQSTGNSVNLKGSSAANIEATAGAANLKGTTANLEATSGNANMLASVNANIDGTAVNVGSAATGAGSANNSDPQFSRT